MDNTIAPRWWTTPPDEWALVERSVDPEVGLFAYNPVPCDNMGHANEFGVLTATHDNEKEWHCSYEGCDSPITQKTVDRSLQAFLHRYLNDDQRTTTSEFPYNTQQLQERMVTSIANLKARLEAQKILAAHTRAQIDQAPGSLAAEMALHRQQRHHEHHHLFTRIPLILAVLLICELIHYYLNLPSMTDDNPFNPGQCSA